MKQRGIFEKVPGSGVWYIRYVDAQGRYRREKAGAKSAAISLYMKRKQEALEGRKLPEKLRRAPASFREIAQDALEYSKHKRSCPMNKCRMKRLLEWFDDRPAESIPPQEFEQRLGSQGWAPATINRYRSLLSLTYRLAMRKSPNGIPKVSANPIRQVERQKENNLRVRFLDEAEEAALRAKIRELYPEHEPEFDLALHTGMRRNEQFQLRWENMDLRLGIVTIADSKNGERRHVPVNDTARQALDRLWEARNGSPYVCLGPNGERQRDWRRWFEECVQKANVHDFRWHDLRHTFASRLAMAGIDLRTIAELLGHKTLAMVMRYAHLAPAHLRAAVDRISGPRTDTTVAPAHPQTGAAKPAYVH